MAANLYLAPSSSETSSKRPVRTTRDPLLNLVRAFRAASVHLDADETATETHFLRLYDRLADNTPECRTTEGAVEALRLVADDLEHSYDGFHAAVLASVQTFLSRRA